MLAAVKLLAARFSDVWLETADTNAAKELSTFCRKFATPLRNALETQGLLALNDPSLPRLHLFFQASTAVYPALSDPALAAPWLMGIPRLKLARAAPSRAALKLEEAFHTFFGPAERNRCLRPGMRAVDLGAAPGGWTWLLAQHHLRVTAVDNGALLPELLESGLVEHIRTDGFRYRPPRPVDWMVCDIVEQPSRIAKLVSDWLRRDDCRYCIFNLKLPMKKRYEEVRRCQSMIREGCWEAGDFRLAFKQLYHDRAEVTGFAARASASARRG
ncbi:MAG: 23S rRNA (cytidine(2498)-2'-O)-methyltransferase RlmM [Gammaproteobacteria bacterium]